MAHFKLDLLTHVTNKRGINFSTYYLVSPITDFLNQTENKQGFITNLSFNEKFTIHTNGQKDLTFSMTDKIMYNNEWMDNPYPHNLHIGSQLLLTDKYNHEYLFTVSKISFQIQELNILYNFTCQDSFSYQAINQNQGYTIENDPTAIDFLGAKTLDEWSQKITQECYQTYRLLLTKQGLYLDFYNNLHTFNEDDQLINVKQIIKPIYSSKDPNTQKDYFQQLFTFSCSNSNAVAALISLGEQIDCVIKTYEHSYKVDNALKFSKYIWFEPKRNPIPTGLKYTPNIDLQNFNFSLNGSNLATVLNITPNHIGDEIVSIFPSVPAFFQTWFQTDDWKQPYTHNLYSRKLLGLSHEYQSDSGTKSSVITINTNEKYIACPLKDCSFSESYPIVNFNHNNNISIIDNITNKATTFVLLLPYEEKVQTDTKEEKKLQYLEVQDTEEIPNWWFTKSKDANQQHTVYAAIPFDRAVDAANKDFHIYLALTRLQNDDELKFAEVADKCPWLESKLINLNYLLSQKIISVDEYNDIFDFLNNDIRILNGQLMTYSQSYYLELHKSTKVVEKYTAIIDKIGAIVNNLITIYSEQSAVNEDVLTDFDVEYSKLFKTNLTEEEDPAALINYDVLISDYFNKTFNANQRFFKHIKQFREYFESHENFTANSETNALTNYSIKADYDNKPIKNKRKQYYSFQSSDFERIYKFDDKHKASLIPSSLLDTDLFAYQDQEFIKLPLADKDITKIYKHKNMELIPVTLDKYDINKKYFLTEADYKAEWNIIPEDRYTYVQKNETTETTYVELIPSEIQLLILKHSTNQYYIRRTNIYTPFDWIRYSYFRNEEGKIVFNALEGTNLKKIPLPPALQADTAKDENTDLTEAEQKRYYQSYVSSLPLDYIYYYGPKYSPREEKETATSSTKYFVDRLNEYGYNQNKWQELIDQYYKDNPDTEGNINSPSDEVLKKYGHSPAQTNLFQQVAFVSNIPSASNTLTQFDLDDYLSNVKHLEDAFIYYSACANQQSVDIARGTGIAALVSFLIGYPFMGIPTLVTSICYSCFAHNNARKADWLTNRKPEWLFEPTIYKDPNESENSKKYRFIPQNTDLNDFYDSKKAIFGKTANAFSTMEKNTLLALLADNSPITSLDNTLDGNKYFFNYYGLIAATYSFEYQNPVIEEQSTTEDKSKKLKTVLPAYNITNLDQPVLDQKGNANYKFWIKNHSYSRILTKDDKIYKYDKYYLVLLDTSEKATDITTWSLFNNDKKPYFNPLQKESMKFSNLQFYWLPKVLLDLSVISDEVWTQKHDMITVEDLNLTQLSKTYPYIFQFNNAETNISWTVLLVHDEPYETQLISNKSEHIDWDNYTLDYKEWKGEQLYNYSSHAPVTLLKEPLPITKIPFYTNQTYDTIDDSFELITKEDLVQDHILFYYKDLNNNEYSLTYSIKQINDNLEQYNKTSSLTDTEKINLLPLYFRNNQHYIKTYLEKERTKFLVNLYQHDIEYDDENNIIRHTKTPIYNQELDFGKWNNQSNRSIIFKTSDNDPYATTFTIKRSLGTVWNNLSNGEIWYKFHNTKESSSLVEQANIIEVQLNEAWNSALNASKMGNYFLPNSWKPAENEQQNSWADQLWHINSNGTISLSYNILPKVFVYKNMYQNSYTEILPKYEFVYSVKDYEGSIVTDKTNILFNDNRSFKLHLELNDYNNEGWTNWHLKENGTCTYYYLDNPGQGIKWKNLLSDTILSSSNKRSKTIYENFDGWYPMMYKLFRMRFSQAEQPLFLELQKVKERKWAELYQAYPNIFLEKTYTNKDATTSKELLEMAELAFNDQLKPEEAYSLTVIDLAEIKGYKGQELNIGDSIQLDTSLIYHNFDDIYNSLTKFLFITDISYDLRKDTDIQLTVNTIKYQEKLLQQLVKLIR